MQQLKTCLHCGKPFGAGMYPSNFKIQRYCTHKCARDAQRFTPERAVKAFWEKVNKNAPNGCWIWIGCRNQWNYGLLRINRKPLQAHRVSYEWANGEIPKGMLVLHKCDNPPCCNPAHLFLGNDSINRQDSLAKGRHACGERTRSSKLTNNQVIEIRALGLTSTQRAIAKRFGVDQSTIGAVLSRRTWKHL